MPRALVGALPAALSLLLSAAARPSYSASPDPDQPAVRANDNRRAAGRLAGGTLTVHLEAREVLWYPEGSGLPPGFPIEVFAEAGGPLLSPGPLLRVPVGTAVVMTVRNRLERSLWMRGLSDRTDYDTAATEVRPGEQREFRFTARRPGTYYYWGRTRDDRDGLGVFEDGQLLGGLIVDAAPPPPNERVLVIVTRIHNKPSVTMRVPVVVE